MDKQRRGACPGLVNPMATGDGLLARLTPTAPIPIQSFHELCLASERNGNGILEITQRGSLQIRGLTVESAPVFARTVALLGLEEMHAVPVFTSPLLGLSVHGAPDLRGLIAALRDELADRRSLASLSPKVSVLIDDGGALHLDGLTADIRLTMTASHLQVSIGGTANTAARLGVISICDAVAVVTRLLECIALRGETARTSGFRSVEDAQALRVVVAEFLSNDAPPLTSRPRAEALAVHQLNDGQVARGFALPFGHATAGALLRFTRAAAACGAVSIRPAPDRAFLVIGLPHTSAEQLVPIAAEEGFIVNPADPRRQVVACAGAPACASATLSTRQLAPAVAEAAGSLLDGSLTVHLSGCTKGCAHPDPAAITIIGPHNVTLHGRAGDAPQATISPSRLLAGLKRINAARLRDRQADETSVDTLLRMGTTRVLEILSGGTPLA